MPLTPAQAAHNRQLQVIRDQRRAERNAMERARLERERRRDLSLVRRHDRDPDVKLYRRTKRARGGVVSARDAALLAEAKRIYEAQMAEASKARNGGRPRKTPRVETDPSDALIVALEAHR